MNDKPKTATPPVVGTPVAPSTTTEPLADVVEVANGYRGNAVLRARAHNIAADRFERRNKYLGVPATIIAAVVGSSIFASLSSNDKNLYLMITTGALSILAAVLSALQTFLKYPEIAQSHKAAKDGYESIARQIDNFKLQATGALMPRPDAVKALQGIADQLDDLGKSSPIISNKLLRAASKEATEFSALAQLASGVIASIHSLNR